MAKGSNASKIARSRAEAAKRAAAVGVGGGGAKGMAERMGTNADKHICAICRATFMANQSRPQLQHHVDSKHSKDTFEKCFPDFKE